MRRRLLSGAAAAVVGLATLAGCAGESRIYNEMLSSGYRPYLYGYGAGRRDLKTIIVGNPFDLSQEQLDARLVTMLNEGPTLVQPTHFTTTPGPSARLEFQAVILINRGFVLPNQMCRAPDRVPAADLAPNLRVTAVFCNGGYLSTVTGELNDVASIDDPRLRTMIRQMVTLLFPPVDPTEDNGNMPWLITGRLGVDNG